MCRPAALPHFSIESNDVATAKLHRHGHSFTNAPLRVRADAQTIDNNVNRVPNIALEFGRVLDPNDLAVHARANETLAYQVGEDGFVLALSVANHGRADVQVLPFISSEQLVDNRLWCSARQGHTVLGAVRSTSAGKEHAQVVEYLRQGSDRRARTARDGALIDSYRRR